MPRSAFIWDSEGHRRVTITDGARAWGYVPSWDCWLSIRWTDLGCKSELCRPGRFFLSTF
jgi:hypothetical protein